MKNAWTFSSRDSGHTRTSELRLGWELNGDPISDNFTPDEIDAEDLLRLWIKKYFPDAGAERLYGAGMVSIGWFIDGADSGTFETAPFTAHVFQPATHEDFLSFYTWPRHADTGEPLNWLTLPVRDKLWTAKRSDKGGFFQQATGWKPAPLQPAVHVPGLLAAVPGLSGLVPYQPRTLN
jgi:hypothetical protein